MPPRPAPARRLTRPLRAGLLATLLTTAASACGTADETIIDSEQVSAAGPSSTAPSSTGPSSTAPATIGAVAPPTTAAGAGGSQPTSAAAPATAASPASAPAPGGGDGPSQSAADAARDGVVSAVAELPPSSRIGVEAELPSGDGGRWVLSRLPRGTADRFISANSGRLGDPSNGPAASDYGEVLLLDADGAIVKAWPMPGAPPNWLVVGPDRVYAGHDGDGGLPDSTLVRIDPATLGATVVLVPSEIDGTATGWPASWHVATGDDVYDYRGAIGHGSGGMTGARAASPLGDVVVSLSSVDGLINRVSGSGG
ncbi:MAG: hypothetical protein R2761_24985 [Acidimicrobiales bacterium]